MKAFNVTNYNIQIHADVNNPVAYQSFFGLNLVDTSASSQAVAFLNFYPDASAVIPNNSVQVQGGMKVYCANFRKSWFPIIGDLLRNEKPLTFWFDEGTKEAVLGTGTMEQVGAGEK